MQVLQRQGDRGALWIALTYALVGILYISFSDRALKALVPSAEHLTTFQTIKGIAYVVLTAVLVYGMVRGQNRVLARTAERMQLSELRYERIFAESPIAIGFYGHDADLRDANPAFLRLFGVMDWMSHADTGCSTIRTCRRRRPRHCATVRPCALSVGTTSVACRGNWVWHARTAATWM